MPKDSKAKKKAATLDEAAELLRTPTIHKLILGAAAQAEKDLRLGPGGGGWQHNSTLRPAAEELHENLQALLAIITPEKEKSAEEAESAE